MWPSKCPAPDWDRTCDDCTDGYRFLTEAEVEEWRTLGFPEILTAEEIIKILHLDSITITFKGLPVTVRPYEVE
jgi:hypothetical protein